MTTTPIAAGPNDVTVRALFEQWYLRVLKGHPNNLTRDENGGYKFLATLYLAFEAGMAVEREACAGCVPTNWCDPMLTGPDAVIGKTANSQDIEALLLAVKKRIESRSN